MPQIYVEERKSVTALAKKSTFSIVRSQAQGRSGQPWDQKQASELRTKAVAKSTGIPESTKTASIVTIRSPEGAVRGSCSAWKPTAMPALLAA